jgi:NAD(P)-dependent dehydrogenase (short-subunit alcohol dehydrogenase family)
VVEALTQKTPLGVPWIDPDDVAPAFVYLASDDARTVTGSALDVTGGDSAQKRRDERAAICHLHP